MGILIFIGVVVFFLIRVVKFTGNFTIHAWQIYRAKSSHSYAEEYASSLDIPYVKKKDYEHERFKKLIEKTSTQQTIGRYKILYTRLIDKDNYLIFSELNYIDLGVNVRGEGMDIKKKAFHDFIVQYDPDKLEATVLSGLYSDNTDKFQKKEFADVLFPLADI